MTDLKAYFQQTYQGQQSFLDNVIFPIFGADRFEDGYGQEVLSLYPELQTVAQNTGISSVLNIGTIDVDFNPISIFDITVKNRTQLNRNRVGIQQIVRRIMSTFSSAFMIFHYEDAAIWDWRFSFCSKANNNELTDNKRYTFLLGPNQSCRTVADNFGKLLGKAGDIELEDIKAAFDVEALSDEFFGKYKQHYERFVEYVTGKRFVKSGGKWQEQAAHEPHPQMYADFGRDDKRVRDYVKKLLGRIVFLHFLQKKGWLGVPAGKAWGEGDQDFMLHLYEYATEAQKEDFLDTVLEPLFAKGLDADRTAEGYLFDTQVALPQGSKVKVPYLNGGLFERDALDEITTKFPSQFFGDLLNFLYQYNFTIDENDPDDAQVGVDPEMLGRIFENLLEDNKDKGAYYTPKEIVRYMCRQSLTAYLCTDISDESKQQAIEEYVKTYDVECLGGASSELARLVDERLKEVKICDPAIGSGAFPMGLLKELFLCRGAIENFDNAANIKRHIIRNNIYGVDIERGAVDIARLRFWLSLVVDEDEPHTLPNLDFKIMQGNSLLEQYQGADLSCVAKDNVQRLSESRSLELFDSMLDVYRKELRTMITQYYSEDNHAAKQALLTRIKANVLQQLQESCFSVDLSHIDLQANPHFFLWHTWFADVLNRPLGCNGFDIVIGNPPYISAPTQIEKPELNKQRQRIVASKRYKSLNDKWDLYVPFMELGMQLLCSNGVFSMIVPYPLTNQKYGKKLRKMIAEEYHLFEIADLNGTKIFENATVSNCIPFIQNSLPKGKLRITKIFEDKTIREMLSKSPKALLQDEKNYVWNLTEEERNGNNFANMNVLGDFCYISVGMVINANEKNAQGVFKKEDLISDSYDAIHCRKYIEAKDIDKYQVKRVRYLEWNTVRCPDKLRRPTFRKLYDCPKLILNCLGTMNATIDIKEHFLHNHSIYCAVLWKDLKDVSNKSISSSIKKFCKHSRADLESLSEHVDLYYLLGILNSSMAIQLLADQRGGDYHIYPEHIRNIPIPSATREEQEAIVTLVNKILIAKRQNEDTIDFELEIDRLVYKCYGLTDNEINSMEKG